MNLTGRTVTAAYQLIWMFISKGDALRTVFSDIAQARLVDAAMNVVQVGVGDVKGIVGGIAVVGNAAIQEQKSPRSMRQQYRVPEYTRDDCNIHPLNGKFLAIDDPIGPLLRAALEAGVPKEQLQSPVRTRFRSCTVCVRPRI